MKHKSPESSGLFWVCLAEAVRSVFVLKKPLISVAYVHFIGVLYQFFVQNFVHYHRLDFECQLPGIKSSDVHERMHACIVFA